jgi:hypothetical protein
MPGLAARTLAPATDDAKLKPLVAAAGEAAAMKVQVTIRTAIAADSTLISQRRLHD